LGGRKGQGECVGVETERSFFMTEQTVRERMTWVKKKRLEWNRTSSTNTTTDVYTERGGGRYTWAGIYKGELAKKKGVQAKRKKSGVKETLPAN